MTIEEELGCLRAAYGNCVNDLARAKEDLKRAEDMLHALAQILSGKAHDLARQHEDNPGTTGSGR
jgi:hypothetical protein